MGRVVKCGYADVRTAKMQIKTADARCGYAGKMQVVDGNCCMNCHTIRHSGFACTKRMFVNLTFIFEI